MKLTFTFSFFFWVEGGNRLAFVPPAQPLDEPGGEEAGGDQRGLAGVAVAGDADGADGFSRVHLHRILPVTETYCDANPDATPPGGLGSTRVPASGLNHIAPYLPGV